MSQPRSLTVAQSRSVESAAPRVYEVIADYRRYHPRIVPPRWFSNLEVISGPGVGAGTMIRFDVRAFGSTRSFRARIEEPELGHVLTETDVDAGTVTTFTVRPRQGNRTDVTIATSMPRRPGVLGRLEGWMSNAFLRRVYKEELRRIEMVAKSED